MSWTVKLTSNAEADLELSHDYYERQGAGLGLRFLTAVRHSLDILEELPTIFGEILPGVRFQVVEPFQQVVYYVVLGDTVHVIGVIHAKRDPNIWKMRRKTFLNQAE